MIVVCFCTSKQIGFSEYVKNEKDIAFDLEKYVHSHKKHNELHTWLAVTNYQGSIDNRHYTALCRRKDRYVYVIVHVSICFQLSAHCFIIAWNSLYTLIHIHIWINIHVVVECWYKFDDSRVTAISTRRLATKFAYLWWYEADLEREGVVPFDFTDIAETVIAEKPAQH